MKVRIKENATGLCEGLNVGDIVEVKEESKDDGKEIYLVYKEGIEGHNGNGFSSQEYEGYNCLWLFKEECEVVEEDCEFVGDSNVSFLPSKVIFNKKKGKTTLLFGEAPYQVYTSVASHGDKFGFLTGFYVTLLKRLYNDADRKIKLAYDLYEDERQRDIFIEGLLFAELQKNGMSNNQFKKFMFWEFYEPLKFVINGVEHVIEVEYKG